MPASDGGIRILTLARYIVQNSLDCLDYERIRLAIDTVNKEVALTYEEVISLRSAIGYAMIEFIYILSRRLIHFNRMQRFAKNGQIMSKHLKSDIYLHFALKGRAGAAVARRARKDEHTKRKHKQIMPNLWWKPPEWRGFCLTESET